MNIFYLKKFFFFFFEDKNCDVTTSHSEQRRKNENFYLFYLSFFLIRLKKWGENRKEEPFLFFCFDRPLFANVHLDVPLIVASFSAQLKENGRKKGNCKFRSETFLFLDFSLFSLFVWSYFYISLNNDCAQSSTIKKVVSLQTRVAIYVYFEWNLAFLIKSRE